MPHHPEVARHCRLQVRRPAPLVPRLAMASTPALDARARPASAEACGSRGQACSAVSVHGVLDGLEWLYQELDGCPPRPL